MHFKVVRSVGGQDRTLVCLAHAGGSPTLSPIANLGALPFLLLERWDKPMPALFLPLYFLPGTARVERQKRSRVPHPFGLLCRMGGTNHSPDRTPRRQRCISWQYGNRHGNPATAPTGFDETGEKGAGGGMTALGFALHALACFLNNSEKFVT